MAENKRDQDTNLGQQGNQNWDDANDQKTSGSSQPNPQRYQDANLGQGSGSRAEQNERSTGSDSSDSERSGDEKSGGSAFNERHQSTSGAGSSQRSERDNVGPLDADLADLPSEKRAGRSSGNNLTGSGLG